TKNVPCLGHFFAGGICAGHRRRDLQSLRGITGLGRNPWDTGIPASRKRSFPEAPPLGWPSSFHSNPSVRTVIVCHTSSCYFACYIWGLQGTLAYLPARTSNMRILTPIGKRRT